MSHALTASLLLIALSAFAEESSPSLETPPSPEKPVIKDLGNGAFEIGLVHFDEKTRTLRFPATVNMDEGPIEFAVVHEQGKIHESILISKVDAFHLNVALKLLRYQESHELFQILDEDYRATGKYPEVSPEIKSAARVNVLLSWKDEEGEKQQAPLNEWITYTKSNAAMPAGPWVYGGSYLHRGAFQAQAQGELIAIFTSSISLFNYPGKDGNLDDVWLPNSERIPPLGTAVTVIIQPFSENSASQ